MLTSVWSFHGHHFIGTGEGARDACLVCGAMYELVAHADNPTSGEYQSCDGSEPMHCAHDTSMVHGLPCERHCDACAGEGCEHCAHDCNCLFCNA